MSKGKTLQEAKSITKRAAADALDGLPKEKMHCSNLGAEALSKAIQNYEDNHS
jgi:nitrogen fixation NifU-like protein